MYKIIHTAFQNSLIQCYYYFSFVYYWVVVLFAR